jgi:hemerythrin-like domain-containing protein
MPLLEIGFGASAMLHGKTRLAARGVRARVLREHEVLRSLLGALLQLCNRVQNGEHDLRPRLRELALELHRCFSDHLAFEDERLLPLVKRAGSWGRARAQRLECEHAEQRMLIDYLTPRLADVSRPLVLLGADLASFAELLRGDIADEESSVLLHETFVAALYEDLPSPADRAH